MSRYRKRKSTNSWNSSGHDPGKCALYCVRDKTSGDVKIGISNNPQRRLVEISETYNVGSVEILSTIWFFTRKEALKFESHFHSKYKNKHSSVRGGREWFRLTREEVLSFLNWVKISNSQRSYKARTLSAKVWKTKEEFNFDRIGSFVTGFFISIFTFIIPLIGTSISGNPVIGFIVLPSLVGIYFAFKADKYKTIKKRYGEDGYIISKEVLNVERELKMMNLWEDQYIQLADYSINSTAEFPERLDDNFLLRREYKNY